MICTPTVKSCAVPYHTVRAKSCYGTVRYRTVRNTVPHLNGHSRMTHSLARDTSHVNARMLKRTRLQKEMPWLTAATAKFNHNASSKPCAVTSSASSNLPCTGEHVTRTYMRYRTVPRDRVLWPNDLKMKTAWCHECPAVRDAENAGCHPETCPCIAVCVAGNARSTQSQSLDSRHPAARETV